MKALDRLRKLRPMEDDIEALIAEFEEQHPFTGEDGGSNDRCLLFNLISQRLGHFYIGSPALLAVAEAAEEWRVADEEYREAANRRAVGELIVMRRVRAEAALRAALARLGEP